MLKSANLARYICVICVILSVVITTGCDDDSTETRDTTAQAPAMTPDELEKYSWRFQNGRAFGINYGIKSEPATTLVVGENVTNTNATPFILVSGSFVANGVVSWLGRKSPYFFNVQESTFPPEFGPSSASELRVRLFKKQGEDGFYAISEDLSVRSDNVEGKFKKCVFANLTTRTDTDTDPVGFEKGLDCLFIRSLVDFEEEGNIPINRFDLSLNPGDQVLQVALLSSSGGDMLDPMAGIAVDPNSLTIADTFPIFRNNIFDDQLVADDSDIFRIKLPSSGNLTVSTFAFTRTHMRLLDLSGQIIASNGSALTSLNAEISTRLPAGTYLVQVEPHRSLVVPRSSANMGPYFLQSIFSSQGSSSNPIVSSNYIDGPKTPVNFSALNIEEVPISHNSSVINLINPQQVDPNTNEVLPLNGTTAVMYDGSISEVTYRLQPRPSSGLLRMNISRRFGNAPRLQLSIGEVLLPFEGLEFRNTAHRYLDLSEVPEQTEIFVHISDISPLPDDYVISTFFIEGAADTDAREIQSFNTVIYNELPSLQELFLRGTLPNPEPIGQQVLGNSLGFRNFFSFFSRGGPLCGNSSGFSPKTCARGLVSLGEDNPRPTQIEFEVAPAGGGSTGGVYFLEVFSSPISPVNPSACSDNIVSEITPDAGGLNDSSDAQFIEEEISVNSCLRITGSNDDVANDRDVYILKLAEDADAITFSVNHLTDPGGELRIFIYNAVGDSPDNIRTGAIIDTCYALNEQRTRINCTVALPQDTRQLVARVIPVANSARGNYTLDILPSRLLDQESLPLPLPR